jgi:hypothetical protein
MFRSCTIYMKNMFHKPILPVLWIAGLLLQTSPAPLRAFSLEPAGLNHVPLPPVLAPIQIPAAADLDGDGSPESLHLTSGQFEILSGSRSVWQSPSAWYVAQAQDTDLDHDGIREAALLVWRSFKPWPVDQWLPYGGRIAGFHNNEGSSCHIILIGWNGSAYDEVWAGSALAEPVLSFAASDLDGDGRQELVTLEGSYSDPASAPGRAVKVWEWNGFGFSVVYGVEGTFYRMALAQSDAGHVLILVP